MPPYQAFSWRGALLPTIAATAVLLVCSAVVPPATARRLPIARNQKALPYQQKAPNTIVRAEKAALLALKAALNNHPAFDGNFQTNNYVTNNGAWNDQNQGGIPPQLVDPCYDGWGFIGCNLQGRVMQISLTGAYLSTLNSSWQRTAGDPLRGYIPWGNMTALANLTLLDISFQEIAGTLSGVGEFPAMKNLSVSFNNIKGGIPEEVSKLKNLLFLNAQSNQLQGALPQGLSSVSGLASLSVAENTLSGAFPPGLGLLTNLTFLDLSANAFGGPLPASWSQLANLRRLQLQKTLPNTSIPDAWGLGMRTLQHVSVLGCGITGTYPGALTKLTSLVEIILNSNKFYGQLPTNVVNPKLTSLDLANNYFNGTLPASATSNSLLTLKADSNCLNVSGTLSEQFSQKSAATCTNFYKSLLPTPPPAPPASSSSSSTAIIVGVVVGVVALLAISVLVWWYFHSRRGSNLAKLFTKGLRQSTREFLLPELKTATQNWGTVIGKGGYGTVYKAVLKDEMVVAVKRLDQVSKQGDVEFIREVELLSRVHHRHLVNLVGFCAERGERALVYEYMAMGSLYEHLHGDSAKQFPLSWDSRCKIAIHVALGIEYLHYGADPPLIHRDIKSANILLSDDGYSKVADFGLCKEAPIGAGQDGSEQLVPTATAVRGSFGYLDPEYVNTSILSEKSDVYSYGVVLLELITGHKSIHDWQPLAYWAEEYLADREKTPLMVDPALDGNFDLDELYALCDIARTCVQDQSVNRPTIRDVAKALVENLGHGMSSFAGSQQDTASIVTSSQADASSVPSSTYTPSSAGQTDEFTYQNYSETLHWTPQGSGQMSTSGGAGVGVSTGAKGDHLPVPVPKRPKEEKPEGGK